MLLLPPPGAQLIGMIGFLEAFDAANRVLARVGRLGADADRVVAVCAGAFALGALRWLDGRRCTTHWLALDQLRTRFPVARVETDALYTEDGRYYASARATAGVDLALHLILQDFGS